MDQSKLNDWLKDAFKFPEYEMTLKDKKQIKYWGVAQWIYEKLLKGEFRRSAVREETKADLLKRVKARVERNEPIYLIVCLGGYKNFWNPSYPEVDFAELFNLRFMAKYVAPILKAYEPGVILDYESEDVIIPWMDNYPPVALDKYAASFTELIGVYSKAIPKNFRISYVRSQTQLDEGKLRARIEALLPETRKRWQDMPEEERRERLSRSAKNIMWKGAQDWTKLNEKEKEAKVVESKIVNEAYYAADWEFRENYFVGDDHIPITLTFALTRDNVGHWLMLGSTRSSFVDFWVGRGLLELRENKVIERVVSHAQYDRIKNKLTIFPAFKDLPSKNLRSIEIGEDLDIEEAHKQLSPAL